MDSSARPRPGITPPLRRMFRRRNVLAGGRRRHSRRMDREGGLASLVAPGSPVLKLRPPQIIVSPVQNRTVPRWTAAALDLCRQHEPVNLLVRAGIDRDGPRTGTRRSAIDHCGKFKLFL